MFEDSENERFRNKKPEVMRMILRSYARNISSEAAVSTIISDIRQSNERTMDTKTYDTMPWCIWRMADGAVSRLSLAATT